MAKFLLDNGVLSLADNFVSVDEMESCAQTHGLSRVVKNMLAVLAAENE
ncbi:hypothetical protein [Novipirellula artificiosorum]|nr:hypothetical protein [Novipirellula artificiosorum]